MLEHEFTESILNIIESELKTDGKEILQVSPLLEYINIKTRSANRGSKARGSFANLYAIYVLVEDYIKIVFEKNKIIKNMKVQFFPIYLKGKDNFLLVKNCKIML